jgi:hypothetical protein
LSILKRSSILLSSAHDALSFAQVCWGISAITTRPRNDQKNTKPKDVRARALTFDRGFIRIGHLIIVITSQPDPKLLIVVVSSPNRPELYYTGYARCANLKYPEITFPPTAQDTPKSKIRQFVAVILTEFRVLIALSVSSQSLLPNHATTHTDQLRRRDPTSNR